MLKQTLVCFNCLPVRYHFERSEFLCLLNHLFSTADCFQIDPQVWGLSVTLETFQNSFNLAFLTLGGGCKSHFLNSFYLPTKKKSQNWQSIQSLTTRLSVLFCPPASLIAEVPKVCVVMPRGNVRYSVGWHRILPFSSETTL